MVTGITNSEKRKTAQWSLHQEPRETQHVFGVIRRHDDNHPFTAMEAGKQVLGTPHTKAARFADVKINVGDGCPSIVLLVQPLVANCGGLGCGQFRPKDDSPISCKIDDGNLIVLILVFFTIGWRRIWRIGQTILDAARECNFKDLNFTLCWRQGRSRSNDQHAKRQHCPAQSHEC